MMAEVSFGWYQETIICTQKGGVKKGGLNAKMYEQCSLEVCAERCKVVERNIDAEILPQNGADVGLMRKVEKPITNAFQCAARRNPLPPSFFFLVPVASHKT